MTVVLFDNLANLPLVQNFYFGIFDLGQVAEVMYRDIDKEKN